MERLKSELEAMVKEFDAVKAAREAFVSKVTEATNRLIQLQGSYATLKKLIEEKGGVVEDPKPAQEVPPQEPAKP